MVKKAKLSAIEKAAQDGANNERTDILAKVRRELDAVAKYDFAPSPHEPVVNSARAVLEELVKFIEGREHRTAKKPGGL